MTKEQFLFQLEQQLLDIPQDEREEAMEYYRDYFDDAGKENEEQVIAELGSPKKVAASIKEGLKGAAGDASGSGQLPQPRGAKSDSGENRRRQQTDSRSKWIIILIVGIFTFPVWIGLAAGVFGILIGAICVLVALAAAAVIITVAGLVAGVICAVVGITRFFTAGFISGLMTFGAGMLLFATGCLFLAFLVLVFGQFVPWLLRSISNVLHRGLNRRRRVNVNE